MLEMKRHMLFLVFALVAAAALAGGTAYGASAGAKKRGCANGTHA
jgi:uncharacterized membrane protein YtjA (UPF0391 family)